MFDAMPGAEMAEMGPNIMFKGSESESDKAGESEVSSQSSSSAKARSDFKEVVLFRVMER